MRRDNHPFLEIMKKTVFHIEKELVAEDSNEMKIKSFVIF